MARIVAHVHVSADFFKYLQAFGQKSYARDEGFSGCDIAVAKDEAGKPEIVGNPSQSFHITPRNTMGARERLTELESCYLLKYVEMHEDPGPTINPWTIRQVAVYQKFHLTSLESHQVVIRPSVAMKEGLYNALQKNPGREREFISRWQNVHSLFLKTLNGNWRHYINYLDEEVSNIVCPPHALRCRVRC